MEGTRAVESSAPLISVVIPHHRGRLIDACLATLKESVCVRYETIVVTSDDRYTAPEGLILLRDPGGPAHKRNVAARCAKGQYLIFLDDDTEVSPYTLYQFWHGFQQLPAAGMLFARIYNAERRTELDDCGSWLTPTGFLYARASEAHLDHDILLQPTRCLASKSAGCAIRRDVFFAIGGFDASYFILGEETDLAWRVWLAGHEVWYWPHVVLWHAFNTSAKPVADYYTLRRIHTYGCRNYLSLLWTNLGTARLILTLPLHLSAWLGASVGFLLRGQPRRALATLRGVYEFGLRLPQLQRKRARVQATRVRTDRALWPYIAHRVPWIYYPRRLQRYIFNGLHG